MEKKTDSKFIGAGVFAIIFTIQGIVNLMNNKNAYGFWICIAIGGLSLVYLLYLLNKTKHNTNERYEDERKELISVKSSSMSFYILFAVIVIMQFLFEKNIIIVESSLLLLIISGIALIINFLTYLYYKYKY